jgi:hypothetical protein
MPRGEFVPTHRLVVEFHGLLVGELVRQTNPFADGKWDVRFMYTKEEWDGDIKEPWLMVSCEVEPLPDWPAIRQSMIDKIAARSAHATRK